MDHETREQPELNEWAALAAVLWHHTKLVDARRLVQRIYDRYGPSGLYVACMAWARSIVTALNVTTGGRLQDATFALQVSLNGDVLDNPDEHTGSDLPSADLAASRFLVAVANDDPDSAYALFNVIGQSPHANLAFLECLLDLVSATAGELFDPLPQND